MTYLHLLARAAVAFALSTAAFLAHATDRTTAPPDPVDADAIVPATRYESVLTYRPAAAGATSPAQNWQALNQQAGTNDAMALTMDGPAAPLPAAVSQEAQPTPRPDPHAHHNKKDVK